MSMSPEDTLEIQADPARIIEGATDLHRLYVDGFESGVLKTGGLNDVRCGHYMIYLPSHQGGHSTIDLDDPENPVRKRTITIQIGDSRVVATFFAMEKGEAPRTLPTLQ